MQQEEHAWAYLQAKTASLAVLLGKGKLIYAACPVAAPPHDLPLVVPLRPGPVLCVLLVPTLPLLAILLSNALTFSRTCPSLRLLALPWPSLLPLSGKGEPTNKRRWRCAGDLRLAITTCGMPHKGWNSPRVHIA